MSIVGLKKKLKQFSMMSDEGHSNHNKNPVTSSLAQTISNGTSSIRHPILEPQELWAVNLLNSDPTLQHGNSTDMQSITGPNLEQRIIPNLFAGQNFRPQLPFEQQTFSANQMVHFLNAAQTNSSLPPTNYDENQAISWFSLAMHQLEQQQLLSSLLPHQQITPSLRMIQFDPIHGGEINDSMSLPKSTINQNTAIAPNVDIWSSDESANESLLRMNLLQDDEQDHDLIRFLSDVDLENTPDHGSFDSSRMSNTPSNLLAPNHFWMQYLQAQAEPPQQALDIQQQPPQHGTSYGVEIQNLQHASTHEPLTAETPHVRLDSPNQWLQQLLMSLQNQQESDQTRSHHEQHHYQSPQN
jgi:hypothetical protein